MINRYKLYLYTFLITFWVYSGFGFFASDVLPGLAVMQGFVMVVCDAVFAVLGLCTIRKRSDIIFAVTFVILGLVSTCILGRESPFHFFNGSRDFLGLIFAVPILRWFFLNSDPGEFRRQMDRQLQWWLYLQAFCITVQFIMYGANDHGGGTMGMGASGLMSLTIYIISFYLVTRNWDSDNYMGSLWKNRVNILLLYPTFLNETKVSFLLFALYFILLIKYDRAVMLKLIYIIPLTIVAVGGVLSLYLSTVKQDFDEIFSEDNMTDYFVGVDLDRNIEVAMMIQDGTMDIDPRDVWSVDIPRFAKILLVLPEMRDTPGGYTFGVGLGQFKGLTKSTPPRFARINAWLLVGSRPWFFMVFLQLGFLGLIWYFTYMGYTLYNKHSLYPSAAKITVMLWFVILIMLFYNEAQRSFNFCVILFYIALSLRYYTPETDENTESITSADHSF